ncbi:hypothetical protein HAX54_029435, partial [Datura stramonium]|nr:hypothetical protein [Datura stramonium]
ELLGCYNSMPQYDSLLGGTSHTTARSMVSGNDRAQELGCPSKVCPSKVLQDSSLCWEFFNQ